MCAGEVFILWEKKKESSLNKNRHPFQRMLVHYVHWYVNANVVSFVINKVIIF